MNRHRILLIAAIVLTLASAAGCQVGPAASGTFDRTLTVSGPVRIDLSNAAGDVQIVGATDGRVHIHAEVRASGFGFGSPKHRVDDLLANPPVEQRGSTIRIGKDIHGLRNVSISYQIEVPHNTEINSNLASGSESVRQIQGPVKTNSASGSLRVDHIDREVRLRSASGSVDAFDIGDDVRASSISGSVDVRNSKGDVYTSATSGAVRVTRPGGRVDASSISGSVEIIGANGDVKAHAVSGRVSVDGNPGSNSYWELKTTSGSVEVTVPNSANFHLTAENVSGQIRADIPIVVEEQSKHSLRARVGNGGNRVEIHTVSGQIEVNPSTSSASNR
jgi:putative adhesin